MKKIVMTAAIPLLVLCVYSVAGASNDTSPTSEQACARPELGMHEGACITRKRMPIEKSPYPLHKWITCLQEKRGWGSGGYSDAIFFSDLIPEWEKEINANLRILEALLSRKDREALRLEQVRWEAARTRALTRMRNQPTQEGTMYMAISAIDEMDFPEQRAIELACRIEKLRRGK